jgi:putative ABC transport system substrate-binding protein
LIGAPLCALAQTRDRSARIALLSDAHESTNAHLWAMFRARLKELGFNEGGNARIDARWADGDPQRLIALAGELVKLQPHVMVADGTPAALAARRATAAIPIVAIRIADPVKTGLAKSLARPAGNVTGNTIVTTDIAGKWLELLRELAPQTTSVAFLNDTSNAGAMLTFRELQNAAKKIGLKTAVLDGRSPASVGQAFDAVARERIDGLIVGTNAIVYGQRDQIVAAAARARIPAVYARSDYVDAGGLVSYGTDLGALYAQAAQYVQRILDGAKPSDLPIEQPMRFELAVNRKTARAIGITLPPSVMVRATRVVE